MDKVVDKSDILSYTLNVKGEDKMIENKIIKLAKINVILDLQIYLLKEKERLEKEIKEIENR
jgi:hypothetical protein